MLLRNAFLAVAMAMLGAGVSPLAADDAKKSDGTVYELRTYTTHPGKMPELHARFRDHTMRLFEKHGIKNVGYWVPVDKPDTLVYLVSHKSREAAAKSWKEFVGDPDWKQAYKESHKNGPLVKNVVSVYMNPTDYSPIK